MNNNGIVNGQESMLVKKCGFGQRAPGSPRQVEDPNRGKRVCPLLRQVYHHYNTISTWIVVGKCQGHSIVNIAAQ